MLPLGLVRLAHDLAHLDEFREEFLFHGAGHALADILKQTLLVHSDRVREFVHGMVQMLYHGCDRRGQALSDFLRQVLLHLLHEPGLGILVRDDVVHRGGVCRRNNAGVVSVEEAVQGFRDGGECPAKPEGIGKRQGQAVDGGRECDLDAIDQGFNRDGHGLVAGRVEAPQAQYESHKCAQDSEACQDIRNHFHEAAVGVVVDLILADVVADVGRAVRLVEKCQVFLVLRVQVGNTEQGRALAGDRGHGASALGDLLHLLCSAVKSPAGLGEAPESDAEPDAHDDEHHRQEAQVVNDVRGVCVKREPCDQDTDCRREQADDYVGESSHILVPLLFVPLPVYCPSVSAAFILLYFSCFRVFCFCCFCISAASVFYTSSASKQIDARLPSGIYSV